jgi:preprotein translocase subunit YajC
LSIPVFLASAADFIAQTTGPVAPTSQPAAAAGDAPGIFQLLRSPMVPIVVIMLVFVVMTSRSRKKQEAQKQAMIDSMKRGDRVQTIGGVLGNVVEVRDDRVLLKLDEGNNTKAWFVRPAIQKVIVDSASADTK